MSSYLSADSRFHFNQSSTDDTDIDNEQELNSSLDSNPNTAAADADDEFNDTIDDNEPHPFYYINQRQSDSNNDNNNPFNTTDSKSTDNDTDPLDNSIRSGIQLFTGDSPLTCMANTDRYILIGNNNSTVTILNINSLRTLYSIELTGKRQICCIDAIPVSSSSSNNLLFTVGCIDGTIILYNLHSRSEIIIKSHTKRVNAIKLFPGNTSNNNNTSEFLIYSVSSDGYFLVHSIVNNVSRIIHSYIACSCPLTCLAINPYSNNSTTGPGDTVILGSLDGTVRLLSLSEKSCKLLIKLNPLTETPVRYILVQPAPITKKKTAIGRNKKSTAASAAANNTGINTNRSSVSAGTDNGTNSANIDPNHMLLYISYGIGELIVYDTRTNNRLVEINNLSSEILRQLRIDNNRLYTVDESGIIKIFDCSLQQQQQQQLTNNNTISSSSNNPHPIIRHFPLLEILTGHSNSINSIYLHSTNQLLLSISSDCTARIYNLVPLNQLIEYKLLQLNEAENLKFQHWCTIMNKNIVAKQPKSTAAGAGGGKKKGKKGSKQSINSGLTPLEEQLAKGRISARGQ